MDDVLRYRKLDSAPASVVVVVVAVVAVVVVVEIYFSTVAELPQREMVTPSVVAPAPPSPPSTALSSLFFPSLNLSLLSLPQSVSPNTPF